MMNRPLTEYTESELRDALKKKAANVQYSYADILGELNRRAARLQGRVAIATSVVSAAVAVVALVLSLVALGRT